MRRPVTAGRLWFGDLVSALPTFHLWPVPHMPHRSGLAIGCLATLLAAAPAVAADQAVKSAPRDRTIGYVLTLREWSIYRTPGAKEECPHGNNEGEREQFKRLYPEDGTERTVLETQLKWEGDTWFPSLTPEPYPYYGVEGKIAKIGRAHV